MFWIQTLIAALIAFGATFSGIFVSFWVERRRKEAEEKQRFARIIRSVLVESKINDATLDLIRIKAGPGGAFPQETRTETLQAALSDPLFHRLAADSLILTVTNMRSHLASINNVLFTYRIAAAVGRPMNIDDAKTLQIFAQTGQEANLLMQEVLENKDISAEQVSERSKQIILKQSQRLKDAEQRGQR